MIQRRLKYFSQYYFRFQDLSWISRFFLIIIFFTGSYIFTLISFSAYADDYLKNRAPPTRETTDKIKKLEKFSVKITSVKGQGEFYIVKVIGDVQLKHQEMIYLYSEIENIRIKSRVIRYREQFDDYLVQVTNKKFRNNRVFSSIPAVLKNGRVIAAVRLIMVDDLSATKKPLKIRAIAKLATIKLRSPLALTTGDGLDGQFLNSEILIRAAPVLALQNLELDGVFHLGRFVYDYEDSNGSAQTSRSWPIQVQVGARYDLALIESMNLSIAPEVFGEILRMGTQDNTGIRNMDYNSGLLGLMLRSRLIGNWSNFEAYYRRSVLYSSTKTYDENNQSQSARLSTRHTTITEWGGAALVDWTPETRFLIYFGNKALSNSFERGGAGTDSISDFGLGLEFDF